MRRIWIGSLNNESHRHACCSRSSSEVWCVREGGRGRERWSDDTRGSDATRTTRATKRMTEKAARRTNTTTKAANPSSRRAGALAPPPQGGGAQLRALGAVALAFSLTKGEQAVCVA